METRKASFLLLALQLLGVLASHARAQNPVKVSPETFTVTEGQILRIDPDGKVTVAK